MTESKQTRELQVEVRKLKKSIIVSSHESVEEDLKARFTRCRNNIYILDVLNVVTRKLNSKIRFAIRF